VAEILTEDDELEERAPLIESSLEELVHTLASKRKAVREAKSAYGLAGNRVKTLQEDEQAILAELERRAERVQQELELE
jgi:uncharacterized coiled-coil protein SlyX